MVPIQMPDGSFISDVKEKDTSNIDCSPFYIEDQSNAFWGLNKSTKR